MITVYYNNHPSGKDVFQRNCIVEDALKWIHNQKKEFENKDNQNDSINIEIIYSSSNISNESNLLNANHDEKSKNNDIHLDPIVINSSFPFSETDGLNNDESIKS